MARQELRFYSLKELRERPPEPNKYLIEGLLWEGDHIILLGSEKAGKSILALQMACALSCGEAFLGEYEIPEAMSVAVIQTEGKSEETVERLFNMTLEAGVACRPENIHLLTTHSWQLDTEEGFDILFTLLMHQQIKPRVIILDPLYMSMSGDLNDNQASRAMARNIRRLAKEFQAAVIVVHHQHREKWYDGAKIDEGDNAIMGSFVWKAFPDHVLLLRCRPDKIRTLTCTTQRSSRVIDNMQLTLSQPAPLCFKIYETVDHMPYVDKVLNHLKTTRLPMSAEDITTETCLSKSAVKKSLSYLTRHNVNKLTKTNPGKRPTLYLFHGVA